MAIVPDLSGNSLATFLDGGVDRNFSGVNRVVAASPNGVTTPGYSGEIVMDTSTQTLWQALGLTNTSWVPTVIEA